MQVWALCLFLLLIYIGVASKPGLLNQIVQVSYMDMTTSSSSRHVLHLSGHSQEEENTYYFVSHFVVSLNICSDISK